MLSLVVAGLIAGVKISSAPKIVHCSIFKNGYAFVTREIDVSSSGEVAIDPIPESVMGSLWFGVSSGIHIKQITNGEVSHKTAIEARSIDELLDLNIGREVNLALKDLPSANGILKSVRSDFVVLTQEKGDQVIFRERIIGLTSKGPLEIKSTTTTSSRSLKVRVEADRPGKVLFVSLERGLSWDSAYLVELKDKKMTLTCRATIVDDLAEIDGIEVLLSAMSPNFSTSSFETLMSGNALLTATLVGGQGLVGESIDFISYDPTDSSLVLTGNQNGANQKSWAAPTGIGGFKREDQFLFRQPDVRLKKGERGQFVLTQKEMPYSDIYNLDVVGSHDGNGLIQSVPHQQVFHHIKFANQTGQPITSAPVSFIVDGQFLGQSLTRYLAPGEDGELSIGTAPEITAEASDEEISRVHQARIKVNQVYDLVTMKGSISLKNLSTKKVKIKVSKTVIGEMLNGSDNPEVQKTPVIGSMNVSSHATWQLELEPGKKVNLTFEYRAYIPI